MYVQAVDLSLGAGKGSSKESHRPDGSLRSTLTSSYLPPELASERMTEASLAAGHAFGRPSASNQTRGTAPFPAKGFCEHTTARNCSLICHFNRACWLRHPRYRVFAQPPRKTKSRGHDGAFLGGRARKRNHRVRMLGQDRSVDSEAHAAGGAGGSHWRTVSQGVSWRALRCRCPHHSGDDAGLAAGGGAQTGQQPTSKPGHLGGRWMARDALCCDDTYFRQLLAVAPCLLHSIVLLRILYSEQASHSPLCEASSCNAVAPNCAAGSSAGEGSDERDARLGTLRAALVSSTALGTPRRPRAQKN